MINLPKIYKMRIVFRFVKKTAGQSNVFNAVRKMVLASGLPFEPAKINANWPRLSYGPAPAQGQRAEKEYLDVYLRKSVAAEEVRRILLAAAPIGLEIVSVVRVPYPLPSVQNLAAAARYRIQGDFSSLGAGRKLDEFVNETRVEVVRRAENGLACITDAKPYILSAETAAPDEVVLTLKSVQNKWIKPEWIVASWLGIEVPAEEEAFSVDGVTVTRECLLWKDSQGLFHPI